jgi:hypothetical protein
MAAPVRPDPDLTARVRALVDSTSISEVGRRLHLADATVARLAGGLPVSEGTVLVAAQRLSEALVA